MHLRFADLRFLIPFLIKKMLLIGHISTFSNLEAKRAKRRQIQKCDLDFYFAPIKGFLIFYIKKFVVPYCTVYARLQLMG